MTNAFRNYYGGDWHAALDDATFEDRNPADESDLIGLFPDSGERDVAAAVGAVASAWRA